MAVLSVIPCFVERLHSELAGICSTDQQPPVKACDLQSEPPATVPLPVSKPEQLVPPTRNTASDLDLEQILGCLCTAVVHPRPVRCLQLTTGAVTC